MLTAVKKVSVSQNMQIKDGFILAPIIDINGLVLRADKEIPEEYNRFLTSQNCNITRVTIDGEVFVRIIGRLALTADEVMTFLRSVPRVVLAQAENIDKMPPAIKFHEIIKKQIRRQNFRSAVVANYESGFQVDFDKISTISGNAVIIKSTKGDFTATGGSHHISGTFMNMESARSIYLSGAKIECLQSATEQSAVPGIMGVTGAMGDILMRTVEELSVQDTLVLSGGEISIEGDTDSKASLSMDINIDWLNNPYDKFLTPMLNQRKSSATVKYVLAEHPMGLRDEVVLMPDPRECQVAESEVKSAPRSYSPVGGLD